MSMEQDIISNYVFLEKQELVQNTIYLWPLDKIDHNRSRLKTVLISLLKEKGAKRASEINKMLYWE